MTSATSSTAHARSPTTAGLRVCLWLVLVVAALIAVLIGLPDGTAEPLQAVLAWSLVAAVAVLGVMAIAKGLELLLDCEAR